MSHKAIILDANILIRAVLGTRVLQLIESAADQVQFYAPDVAFADAMKYLPNLIARRDTQLAAEVALRRLMQIVQSVEIDMYSDYKAAALERIAKRDADDWHILACAMTFNCPIWTEDQDFFGSGVATWTTDRVGLYFSL
jgi:predicted nucleic acid-binding protein